MMADSKMAKPKGPMSLGKKQQKPNNNQPSLGGRALPDVHVSAAYISNVKKWIKYKDCLEIVFDIYAQLDSPVHTRENGRKEFQLTDETGSIFVSYYEIDHPMQTILRGTWIKVTCVWRYWGLQAVKVEIAQIGYELSLPDKARVGQKALYEKLNMLNNNFGRKRKALPSI